MRRFVLIALVFGVAGGASAAQLGTTLNLDGKGIFNDPVPPDGRMGGENIASAVVIPYLPFQDSGVTCGYVNDYDEVCPYSGSTSADLVYSYTPTANGPISVDLCTSMYDTKVYIYAGGPGNLVACNDDAGCGYSGYQSLLENVNLSTGVTYYIVIDGYGGSCGTYYAEFSGGIIPGYVECPPGALQEDEPLCGDDYVDNYNGGCNSNPHVFQLIPGGQDGCSTMCGKSGTYLYQGSSYRDTDWFECTAAGGQVDLECIAEFPLQLILIYNPDCGNLLYDLVWSPPGIPGHLSRYFEFGATFWAWVGSQVFSGIPCTADYTLDVCGLTWGIDPPNPVVAATWGSIKNRFR